MKAIIAVLSVFAFSVALAATPPELQLIGVATIDGKTAFIISDAQSKTTWWVGLGYSARNYTLESYDESTEELRLSADSVSYTLRLEQAKVLADATVHLTFPQGTMYAGSSVTSSGPISESDFRQIGNNLRQLWAAFDYYERKHKGKSPTFEELVGPGKPVKFVKSAAGEDYSKIDWTTAKDKMEIRTSSGGQIVFKPAPAK